jgi:uncharacterized membrane protein YhaH (DUF805 family)
MIDYYLNALKFKYADFDGRARRSEYWYYVLCNYIVIFLLAMIASAMSGYGFILVGIYLLAIIVPSIAMVVRRLHDVGKSGAFYFIALIPIIGGIWLFVLLVTDSDYGPNQYGPNPKGIGNKDNFDDQINSIGTSLQP